MRNILCILFIATIVCPCYATTVNYNWLVDGTNYAQTTCETGDDLILPTPAPTKYGYHFVGWVETTMLGTWSQAGTPTPQNPIEPTFAPFGNTVLRAVGTGDNLIADSYDPLTRKILRRIGVKVLDGTEDWKFGSFGGKDCLYTNISQILQYSANVGSPYDTLYPCIMTHFTRSTCSTNTPFNHNEHGTTAIGGAYFGIIWDNNDLTAKNNLQTWLAEQYANGTPVTIYYPLATPVEENVQ